MADAADRRRYLLWRTLGTLLEQLPVQLAVHVAEAVGWAVAWRETPTRAVAASNLRSILELGASTPVDKKVLDRWVRRYFASYARYWAEGATLPAVDPGVLHSRIDMVEGLTELRASMATGQGVVLALPHIGSWEWGGAFLARIEMPMTAVAERLEPQELFDWFIAKREAIGLHIEALGPEAGKTMLSTLRAGGLVGLLCDRDISGDGIAATLLGRPSRMPAGPATLALRTGAQLHAGVVFSGPGNQHCAHVSGPLPVERQGKMRADVARLTQDIADEMTALIRRSPEQWHVFVPGFTDAS